MSFTFKDATVHNNPVFINPQRLGQYCPDPLQQMAETAPSLPDCTHLYTVLYGTIVTVRLLPAEPGSHAQ